jgi:hypothetical protein
LTFSELKASIKSRIWEVIYKNDWKELDDFSLCLSEKMARKIIKRKIHIGISILDDIRTNFFKINNITKKQFVEELTEEIRDILQLYKPIKQKRKTNNKNYKNVPREDFSEDTKIQVLRNQDHRCVICGKILDVYDFDHIDGDRSNNDISNCRALCPTCHAKITRRRQSKI